MTDRLVCVSNRITAGRKTAAPGGLAVGVLSALQRTGGMWFGWGGELTDEEPKPPSLNVRSQVAFATIELRREEFERYYNGFANEALWPLFHYFPGLFRFRPEQWQAYQDVNRTFARQLVPLLRSGDKIWVHDYHLIPLARYLRELGVRAPIGFFLHIPFPHIETLRVLPTYADLVADLTVFDVIGFQTESDLRSFHSSIRHLYGEEAVLDPHRVRIGSRTVCADVFPIGVDVEGIQRAAVESHRATATQRMVKSLVGRKLIIGVDRLDYSKGLVERFKAYEQFLEAFPENHGQVVYLQIAPLSRKDVQSYAQIRSELERAAGRTNGRFAETDWTPVRYLNRNFSHSALMGLMRAADVALVTPLRDGMNLVAKEYLAAQDPDDPGVLVLSTLAGAAHELTAAMQINPYDLFAVGRAIEVALTMPRRERRERHRQLLASLRRNDIATWVDRFLAALNAVSSAAAASEQDPSDVASHLHQ
jgi:trehalose 6-phosphate synthase